MGQHKLDLLKDSDRLMKHGMIAVVIKKVGNLLNKKTNVKFLTPYSFYTVDICYASLGRRGSLPVPSQYGGFPRYISVSIVKVLLQVCSGK